MNRTDRLLAIMLELQAKKWVRATDLADAFEVSERTIYRDMTALSESGVPLVSVTGQGYSLVEGYFLPPLAFTTDEAMMLLLGSDFVAGHFDAQYRNAAHSANQKIMAVLSETLRHDVEYLASSIQFVVIDERTASETLQQLRRAIIQRKAVRFTSHARYHDGQPDTERIADPYALVHIGGTWMLIAYCHLRKDNRHFRLDRMENIFILNNTFARPKDFRIQFSSEEDRTVVARALFDHEAAPRVRETPSGFQVGLEEHPQGLLVTFMLRQPEDLLQWLLGWGSHVRVLEPDSLRARVAYEAEATLRNHGVPEF
ncbi:MAG: YafY family transcriptional regulator [Anaerolineae bacterium]|nr:YafY family transcriptional regulator [Anaerolineae bacterium]